MLKTYYVVACCLTLFTSTVINKVLLLKIYRNGVHTQFIGQHTTVLPFRKDERD